MDLPVLVQIKMRAVGFNHAEPLEIPGREAYILSLMDSNGDCVPTGLPFIVEIIGKGIKLLQPEEAFELLAISNGKDNDDE